VLQFTDAGNCFADDSSASVNIAEVAATTECPRELIKRKVAVTDCYVFRIAAHDTSDSIATEYK